LKVKYKDQIGIVTNMVMFPYWERRR